jgi:hypothetical protein
MTTPLSLLNEIETLILGQKLNCAKIDAGGHGAGVAMAELRRVTNEVRLKAEHFRALTSPSLDPKDYEKVDAEHQRRWLNRKGISGQV